MSKAGVGITKRLSRTKKPDNNGEKTYQQKLTNEDIAEKLKGYKKVDNIQSVPLGTHLRYFSKDKKGVDNFRLGGIVRKFGDNGEYLILSNGSTSWSAQIGGSIFFAKMTDEETKAELRKEIEQEMRGGSNKQKQQVQSVYQPQQQQQQPQQQQVQSVYQPPQQNAGSYAGYPNIGMKELQEIIRSNEKIKTENDLLKKELKSVSARLSGVKSLAKNIGKN